LNAFTFVAMVRRRVKAAQQGHMCTKVTNGFLHLKSSNSMLILIRKDENVEDLAKRIPFVRAGAKPAEEKSVRQIIVFDCEMASV
jgi:hypothetical protein